MADVEETPTAEVIADQKVEEKKTSEADTENGKSDEKPEAVTESKNGKPADADAETAANKDGADPADDVNLTKEERAIIRQVEYYFGDANLNRDKFLTEQISKDADGWVPLSVLVTFKRLAALSTDFEEIINALIKSDEGLLEISDDKQSLRRHPERPIPEHNEEHRKEIQSRAVYLKGFPLDSQMADLLDFSTAFEKISNLTMRKYLDKATKSYKFKGSVFFTFETIEQAKAFMALDKVVYKERELLRKWQKDYLAEKQEEYQRNNEKKKNKNQAKADPPIDLPKNAIVVFSGAAETTTREELREVIDKIDGFEVAFIEFNKGQTEGAVRLTEADKAQDLIDKLESKLKLNDEITLSLRKATEEEENKFLEKAIEFMKKRRDFARNKNNKRSGRKRFGGNNDKHHSKKARAE